MDEAAGAVTLERIEDHHAGRFTALGGPCEVLADTDSAAEARAAVEGARAEALRIERKFSRYRDDSVLARVHAAAGAAVVVDEETAHLLDYAATCHELSEGRFDVTSGVLRRAWSFDGSACEPDPAAIAALRACVGWEKVQWRRPELRVPAGMELDLGGIGKEYAVDRALQAVAAAVPCACLVNFGGDLAVTGPRRGGRAWRVGVDDPERTGAGTRWTLELERGALATSGDARRYVLHRGRRLGHILDPRTGWPVADAPRAVTVLAGTCLEAGTLSTLAILHGAGAASFLAAQGVRYWLA